MKRKVVIISLVFMFCFSSLSVALQTKSDRTTNEISLLDNLRFDELFRDDQLESRYEYYLKNETMVDHSSTESEPFYSNTDSNSEIIPTVGNYDDALMDSCWPMKSQNRRHTGLSPYNTQNINGQVKWSYKTDSYIEGGLVIDEDNILYFDTLNYYIYAVFPNGTLKWRYKTDGAVWSTPALASDGTVYVGSYDAKLYAMNANGTLKWKTSCGGSISSSPAIGSDGTIYLGTFDGNNHGGYIVAMNPNGTLKWRYETGYHVVSDPAIADDGTIYIGSGDSYLYALNPDGTLKWRFKTGDIVKSHPAIGDDGTIYFDSFDDYLYALNPDGTMQWKYHDVGDGSAGPAIDENGIIYIGGRRLSAIYPNGTLKWHYSFGKDNHSGHSSPAISADGIIYIGVSNSNDWAGYIYSINTDGTLNWMEKVANFDCESSPAISQDGNMYIGTSSNYNSGGSYGKLYAFGPGGVENNPPEGPSIDGPTSGKTGDLYTYIFNSSDPDSDMIYYLVYWGDGSISEWQGPYESGKSAELSHSWPRSGFITIKAKVKDEYGLESDWSTLTVTMPKNRLNHGTWFLFDWLKEFFDVV